MAGETPRTPEERRTGFSRMGHGKTLTKSASSLTIGTPAPWRRLHRLHTPRDPPRSLSRPQLLLEPWRSRRSGTSCLTQEASGGRALRVMLPRS